MACPQRPPPPSPSRIFLGRTGQQATLRALDDSKNERLWFKTQLKLATLCFQTKEFARMAKIIKQLHKSCQRDDGTDDQKKGTQLLEARFPPPSLPPPSPRLALAFAKKARRFATTIRRLRSCWRRDALLHSPLQKARRLRR